METANIKAYLFLNGFQPRNQVDRLKKRESAIALSILLDRRLEAWEGKKEVTTTRTDTNS